MLACLLYCSINKKMPSNMRPKLTSCFNELLLINSFDSELVKRAIALFINELLPSLESFKLIGALLAQQYIVKCLNDDEYHNQISQVVIKIGYSVISYFDSIGNIDYNNLAEAFKILDLVSNICERLVTKYSSHSELSTNSNPIMQLGFLSLFDKILTVDVFKSGCSLICFHNDANFRELANSAKYNVMKSIARIAQSSYANRLEQIQLKEPNLESSAFKDLTAFYVNMIRFLLKEMYIALDVSVRQGITFTERVSNT